MSLAGVHFRYPGASDEALTGVDVEIAASQVVALVGENGSGKSTVAKILAGLYTPSEGAVRWDGRTVTDPDRPALRASVASLFQDFVRYELTAAENIDLRAPDVPEVMRRARRAVAAAGLGAVVEGLPQGLDTMLGHRFAGAVDISGGQWQRFALARALAQEGSLVVLDEPSSALDPRAESEFFTTVRSALRGRAALVVSHRYVGLQNVDRIYVLEGGRVVEVGRHDELIRRGGLYAELFRLQSQSKT